MAKVHFDSTTKEAALFFKVHLEDVTPEMRAAYKMMVFVARYSTMFRDKQS